MHSSCLYFRIDYSMKIAAGLDCTSEVYFYGRSILSKSAKVEPRLTH